MAKYDVAIRGGRFVDGAGNPETAIPSEKPFAPASGGAAIRTLPGQDLEVVAWPPQSHPIKERGRLSLNQSR